MDWKDDIVKKGVNTEMTVKMEEKKRKKNHVCRDYVMWNKGIFLDDDDNEGRKVVENNWKKLFANTDILYRPKST